MLLAQLGLELDQLTARIEQMDAVIHHTAVENEACQRLTAIPGVGPVAATALVAAIGNGSGFRRGRDLAAWVGMVPREYSTGGKQAHGYQIDSWPMRLEIVYWILDRSAAGDTILYHARQKEAPSQKSPEPWRQDIVGILFLKTLQPWQTFGLNRTIYDSSLHHCGHDPKQEKNRGSDCQ